MSKVYDLQVAVVDSTRNKVLTHQTCSTGLYNLPERSKWVRFLRPWRRRRHLLYQRPHHIALGLNAASPNAEQERTFLEWVGSPEIATLYANALPGFFLLNFAPDEMEDPLAQEFVSWRETREPAIRSNYQILSRGTPNLENETWNASVKVINGTETPEDAAARLQEGVAAWYPPQQ